MVWQHAFHAEDELPTKFPTGMGLINTNPYNAVMSRFLLAVVPCAPAAHTVAFLGSGKVC